MCQRIRVWEPEQQEHNARETKMEIMVPGEMNLYIRFRPKERSIPGCHNNWAEEKKCHEQGTEECSSQNQGERRKGAKRRTQWRTGSKCHVQALEEKF